MQDFFHFEKATPIAIGCYKRYSAFQQMLNADIIRKDFPADARFDYGIAPRDEMIS